MAKKKETIKLKKEQTEIQPIASSRVVTVDNKAVNIDELPWISPKLTNQHKLIIFYFCCPMSPAFRDAKKVIEITKMPQTTVYRTLRQYSADVTKISQYFLTQSVENAYHTILQRKMARINYDVGDYYYNEALNIGGNIVNVTRIKPIDELTKEQRQAIVGIEFCGQKGIANYKFIDKVAEENRLLETFEKMNGQNNNSDYSIELTSEIIKGNLKTKVKLMKEHEQIVNVSELANNPTDYAEED